MIRPMNPSEVQKKRNCRTGIKVKNAKIRGRKLHITSRQILLIALLLFIFMSSGIGYVWSSFEGTQIGYDLSRLRQEELRLKDLSLKLKLELATLRSPQYLEEATRGSGLRGPLPEQIIVMP